MNARNHKEYTSPGFDSMHATLATQRQRTPLLLAPVGDNTVELDFDGGRLSSDAGLILLKDIDDQLGLTRALAAVLADARDARRIHFTPDDLLKQRVLQIAAGYEDANDANTLRHDPIFKLDAAKLIFSHQEYGERISIVCDSDRSVASFGARCVARPASAPTWSRPSHKDANQV